jgi:hypothetical protein
MKHIKKIDENRLGEFEPPKRISNRPNRILLDEDDFIELISGSVIKKDDTLIALSDIGYQKMISIIKDKM